ncbi:MAG: hypothetical protein JOZ69_01280 [Myxococcales bacterium]|nr:hypothetical protein [Myxococcales bacterium]
MRRTRTHGLAGVLAAALVGCNGARTPGDAGNPGSSVQGALAPAARGSQPASSVVGRSEATGQPPAASPGDASPGPLGVRWIGRVDTSTAGAAKFAWSGTGFVATVNGTRVSARLQTEMARTAFFQVVVDGHPGARLQVPMGDAQTVVLADGLAPGDHTIELYRETEGMYGDSVFSGLVEGSPRAPPARTGRLIEVIGDSISAGYGNLGNEVHPPWDNSCSFSLDTESAYQSYASILGRALAAEVSIVARSGWGVYRDSTGSTSGVLSAVYDHAVGTAPGATWDFQRKPNAVIINLGTNDGAAGDPGAPFEDAYVALLLTVRGHYPDAWIFLTLGPMTIDPLLSQMRAHLKKVAARAADTRLATVDIPAQDPASTGCDYHPNVAEDALMAGILAPAVRAKLGW